MTDESIFKEDSSLELVASKLEVLPLLKVIQEMPHLWHQNTWRQDEAGGQQDTQAIMFRWANENNFASVRDSVSVKSCQALFDIPEAMPLLKTALAAIGAIEWGRCFVVKLKPGGRVYPHSDVGTYADKFERFHICLQSNPGFEYSTQHPTGPIQTCNMMAGDLWWFNHKRVHWAYNGGSSDRISIVLDAVAPKWKRKRDLIAVGVGYQYDGKDKSA